MIRPSEIYLADNKDILDCKAQIDVPLLVPLDTDDQNTPIIHVEQQKRIIEKLPASLRPKLLSSLVQEEIVPSCLSTKRNSKMSKTIKEKLNDEIFHRCLLRLVRADQSETFEIKKDQQHLNAIEMCLQRFQVVALTTLRTRLLRNNAIIEGSEKDQEWFIERNRVQNLVHVYVHTDVDATDPVLCKILGQEIIKSFAPFQNKAKLAENIHILLQKASKSMNRSLDKMQIPGYGNFRRLQRKKYPKPGAYVPLTDIGYLKQTVTRLEVGEYAAYEVNDPLVDDDNNHEEKPEGIYIFVKILEVIPPKDTDPPTVSPMLFRYRIDMGEKTEVVFSGLLYRFEDGDTKEEEKDDAKSEEPTTEPQLNTLEEIKAYITQRLEDVWELDNEREKRVIFKRLALQFHPDKNPHRVGIATAAFKFIQQEIDRLDRGEAGTSSSGSGKRLKTHSQFLA